MKTLLAGHPQWRQVAIVSAAVPLVIVLVVLTFAWPSARIAPRDLPIGIVGSNSAAGQAVTGLTRAERGGFDLHVYADEAGARTAIENRDVYGAFVVTPQAVTVLEASAASPSVAQLLTSVGNQLGSELGPGRSRPLELRTVDVVPTSSHDPRGAVLNSVLLPLTICGVLVAAAIALLLRLTAAWRKVAALVGVSATAGLGIYVIAQGLLGALPGEHVATWASLALTVLAVSSSTAGLIALLGAAGLGLGAALMVVVGNPFSGVTSAPQLLPTPVGEIGQWLPPGAAVNLLRSTAYFGGNGAVPHLAVLLLWSVLGLVGVIAGHHGFGVSAVDRRATPPAPVPGPASAEDLQRRPMELVPASGQHRYDVLVGD